MQKVIVGCLLDDKVQVAMEIGKKLSDLIEKKKEYTIVKIDGILIVILEDETAKKYLNKLKRDQERTKQEMKKWMQKNIQTKEKAIGVMIPENVEGTLKINPMVWVKEIDTMFYETACGSGSLATAIWQFAKTKKKKTNVMQPSGYTISIELQTKKDEIKKAMISGVVKEVAL